MILRVIKYGILTSLISAVMGVTFFYHPSPEKKSAAYGAPAFAAPGDANVFVNLSKKVVPSVVNISTFSVVKNPYGQGSPDDLFRRFFEDFFQRHGGGRKDDYRRESPSLPNPDDEGEEDTPRSNPRLPKAMSLGTGFVIDSSGLILTNNHVVAGADEIKIYFTEASDEKPTDGEIVGRDPEIDIALIKVKTKRELVPIAFGDSDALEVGEYVMAVGNPFGQGHSVTHGIISAKSRLAPDFPLANYLQTDAPINPGNSGGPLVNLRGEVIGINNAIDQRAQGIGFAIPINLVKKVLPQLRSKGTVARGYIGVLVNELTPEVAAKIGVDPELTAPFITHVYPGQPADKAGIKPYDVVLEVAGKPIHSGLELISAVTAVSIDETVSIKVLRGSAEKTLNIKIAQRPGTSALAEADKKDKKKDAKAKQIQTGMILETITPEDAKQLGLPEKSGGVLVASVMDGGPADQAGLARGDIILEIDRSVVKNVDEFYSIVKEKKSYLLRIRRSDSQGREGFAVVVLGLKE